MPQATALSDSEALAAVPRDGRIVVLTGAGISKESGLDTFRDAGGIWSRVRIEDVATPEAFERDPERVHAFYNHRRAALLDPAVAPNPAHLALARLESEWPGEMLLVTQNIDDLHERAGSRNLLHMHGELLRARCLTCGAVVPWREDMGPESACPACATLGRLRVDVVWFGEMPFHMDEIALALSDCALFVAIGTSGTVYPAAGFVEEARFGAGAHTVELNLEPSDGRDLFAAHRYGPASEIVPAFVDALLAGTGEGA
jgi:NAD-dependent deacetylase